MTPTLCKVGRQSLSSSLDLKALPNLGHLNLAWGSGSQIEAGYYTMVQYNKHLVAGSQTIKNQQIKQIIFAAQSLGPFHLPVGR